MIWFVLTLQATADSEFDDSQKKAIEEMIRDYLLANPGIVAEAMDKYIDEREAKMKAESLAALRDNWDELANDPTSYVAGNPDGDVTVIEFFDYNCSFCRLALPTVIQALENDPELRVVFKEFPIRGRDSDMVARLALASMKQGKYFDYHVALMKAEGQMTLKRAEKFARDVGLNVKQLRKDKENPEHDNIIARNEELADLLFIDGTPGFLIGEEIIRGWPGEETFLRLIEEAREAD